MKLKVFLSYAKEDGAVVMEFHDHLKALGFDPWMDKDRLLPGEAWEREIDKALKAANVVVLFMSKHSVNKRSFVTREANMAVQNLRYRKADDIYIIPVLLTPCEVPQEISERAQYIDYSGPGAKNKIVAAINKAAQQQNVPIRDGVEQGPYKVFTRSFFEKVGGQPGYEVSIDYPEFTSATFAGVANSLSAIFAGRASELLLNVRTKPWNVDRNLYPAPTGEPNLFHMNGRWDNYGIASATEKNISLFYNCSWYGAGAMHSNEFHQTYNFAVIDGKPFTFVLPELFIDQVKAAEIISQECRRAIAREYWNRCGEDIDSDTYWEETFLEATAPQLSNFETFTVTDGKLTFYFAPYRVAAYSFGSWVIDIPMYDLRDVLVKGEQSPLQL